MAARHRKRSPESEPIVSQLFDVSGDGLSGSLFDFLKPLNKRSAESPVTAAMLQVGKKAGARPYFSPSVVCKGMITKMVIRPPTNKITADTISAFRIFSHGKGEIFLPFPKFFALTNYLRACIIFR
jgi:hypothetical protein